MPFGSAIETQTGLLRTLKGRGFDVAGSAWTQLVGGRTNSSWKVESHDQCIVVKLFSPDGYNPLFPNDPDGEVAALRHLSGRDLAPAYVDDFSTDYGHCLIYEHVPGRTWQDGPLQIAELLYRVHCVTGPPHLRITPDGSREIEHQTKSILALCPQFQAQSLLGLRPKGAVQPSGRLSFLHGDPVPGNIVGMQGSWRLIDWQCPALGDPCEDLALFLSPAMQLVYRKRPLTDNERETFLFSYPDKDLVLRYLSLAPWYHWRMAAYCLWLESRGDSSASSVGAAEIAAMAMVAS
ncbi:thiamine kinase [Roseovarius sp. MBR-51]